jgi:hypothetical protein
MPGGVKLPAESMTGYRTAEGAAYAYRDGKKPGRQIREKN